MSLEEEVEGYCDRFNISEKFKLKNNNIPPAIANEYNHKLNIPHIIALYERGYMPDCTQGYSEDYDSWDIVSLVFKECSPEEAKEYNPKIPGAAVATLFGQGILVDKTFIYDVEFDGKDLFLLVSRNVAPETALNFKKFNGSQILEFIDKGIEPEIANPYNSKYSASGIIDLIEAGCSQQEAEKYDEDLGGKGIATLFKASISPNQSRYNERFSGEFEKESLASAACPSDIANEYPEIFSGKQIAVLYSAKCLPLQSMQYKGFDSEVIVQLALLGISPEQANKCKYKNVSLGMSIYKFDDFVEREGTEEQKNSMSAIESCLIKNNAFLPNVYWLATGAQGSIIRSNNEAWKVMSDTNEFELLKRTKGCQNIVQLSSEEFDQCIKLDFVFGPTISDIVYCEDFTEQDVIKYGSSIMDGLIQMRDNGIYYHRDLRPSNIIIDEINERAVIIDLGLATTDPYAIPEDNRRFGSPYGYLANDIISLGQIMYYMATTNHIFSESRSMRMSFSDTAEEIADYRSKVYSDPTGQMLQERLQHVDNTIQDKKLANIIKTCLTTQDPDYNQLKKLFGDYQ